MYKLTLQNEAGNNIVFNQLGGAFTITEIEGLNPPEATINTSQIAMLDGEKFNSAKVHMRTLEIAFAIEKDAERNRIEVYRVVKPKRPITVFYVSDLRDVYINGYVQAVEINYFEQKQICTVTILCPYPFWQAAQSVVNELSQIFGMFHFPFASTVEPEIIYGYIDQLSSVDIDNAGDLDTGLVFQLYARAQVVNPKIYDYITQEFIGLNYTLQPADLVTINTNAGQKSVKLLREGETINIFNALMKGSSWLQLPANGGTYTFTVGGGSATDLNITISHNTIYEGV
jgi:hypothetical protein